MAVSQNDQGQGLWRYNIQNKSIKRYLERDKITAIWLEEREIWVGVKGKGLLHGNLEDINIKFKEIVGIKEEIMSLARDGKGRIWVGTNNGEIYREYDQKMIPEKCIDNRINQLSSAYQIAVTKNPDIVWIASTEGLLRWQIKDSVNRLQCYHMKDYLTNGSVLPVSDLTAVAFNPKNSLLVVGTGPGDVAILQKGAMTPNEDDDVWDTYPKLTSTVRKLIILPDQSLIAVTEKPYLSISDDLSNDSSKVYLKKGNVEKVYDAFLTPDNILWIGTDQGLYKSDQ